MSEVLGTSLMIAAIGLPVMIGIIVIFILLARALVLLFPGKS